jgi:hypothetical protein
MEIVQLLGTKKKIPDPVDDRYVISFCVITCQSKFRSACPMAESTLSSELF